MKDDELRDTTLEHMEFVELPSAAPSESIKLEHPAPAAPKPTRAKLAARVQRTLRSSFAFLARPDDAWAQNLLPSAEYAVYVRMDGRDREHAVRVAKEILRLHPDASRVVLRAALLHDCGKQVRPYNVFERIWVGLRVAEPDRETRLTSARLTEITTTRAERVGSRKTRARQFKPDRPSAADVRRFHPQIGAWLIRAAGGDERVALIVEHHHHPGDDPEINWVHAVDELE